MKDKQVDRGENDKVSCIDDISDLVEKVNFYDICLGIDK